MPKQLQQNHGQMRTRAFARVPASVDVEKKSFGIVISTETPVRSFIRNPAQPNMNADDSYIEVDEVLLTSGLDFSRTAGMPLVDCHDTFSGVNTILGKVDDVRSVGTEVHGTAVLNSRNSDLITDINDGHYNQISAGYGVNSYEIEHRDGDVPVAYATSWTLYEASLVAVGADPNASVRSAGRTIPAPKLSYRNKPVTASKNSTRAAERIRRKLEKRTMNEEELVELVEAAEAAAEIVEEAVTAVEAAVAEIGDDVSDEVLERVRKLRAESDEEQEERKRSDDTEEERGKRNDEEDKKEEEEIRSIRSIAKSYGLSKAVDDLVALGTRSKDLKASIRSAIMSKAMNANSGARSDIEPKPVRKEPKLTSARDIYAKLNKRA